MVDLYREVSKSEPSSSTIVESTPRHNYFTRLSARQSHINLLNNPSSKVPYVNLSNSRLHLIEHNRGDFLVRSASVSKKRDSTDLGDFTDDYQPTTLVLYENLNNSGCSSRLCDNSTSPMDYRRCPPRRPDSSGSNLSCLSTIVVIIVSTLLTSLSFMHQMKKDVGQVNEEVTNLKQEMGEASKDKTVVNERLTKIEQLLVDIKKHITNQTDEPTDTCQSLKSLIKLELSKLEEERNGPTDFALESSGGRILKLLETENYDNTGGKVLGVSLCEGSHGPRAMIQPGTAPGQCWAFKGSRGTALIKLLGQVKIDGVSIQHIPKKKSPTGSVDTAPKDFMVKGIQQVKSCGEPIGKGVILGKFTYDINGAALQNFPITSQMSFEYVQLHILSNHGNPQFTCVYRFQVHGMLDSTDGNY